MSRSREGVAEYAVHGRRSAVPLRDLGVELLSSFGGDAVVPRAAVVLARAPLGANPAAPQHGLQRRVERSLVDVEDIARDLAKLERESPAMHGFFAEQLEGEHLEGAAHDFGARREERS